MFFIGIRALKLRPAPEQLFAKQSARPSPALGLLQRHRSFRSCKDGVHRSQEGEMRDLVPAPRASSSSRRREPRFPGGFRLGIETDVSYVFFPGSCPRLEDDVLTAYPHPRSPPFADCEGGRRYARPLRGGRRAGVCLDPVCDRSGSRFLGIDLGFVSSEGRPSGSARRRARARRATPRRRRARRRRGVSNLAARSIAPEPRSGARRRAARVAPARVLAAEKPRIARLGHRR